MTKIHTVKPKYCVHLFYFILLLLFFYDGQHNLMGSMFFKVTGLFISTSATLLPPHVFNGIKVAPTSSILHILSRNTEPETHYNFR